MKKIVLAGLIAAAAAIPALAQVTPGSGISRAQVETRVRDAFARVDVNRDGAVTKAEGASVRAEAKGERRSQRVERRADRFAALDANRDGMISRAEFDAPRAKSGGDRAERRENRLERRGNRGAMAGGLGGRRFERLDTDKDGRVTLAEASTHALARFDRIDVNRDGRITRDERRTVRAARQARRG